MKSMSEELERERLVIAAASAIRRAEAAEAEVTRLRGLVKDAEWTGKPGYGDHVWCPWCSRDDDKKPHRDGCPAFTPSGCVK